MESVRVRLGERTYSIIIGTNILPRLGRTLRKLKIGQEAAVVTTRPVNKLYGGSVVNSLTGAGIKTSVKEVPDTEKSKSLRCAGELLTCLAELKPKKPLFVVAFGGGVIGDLAGFVAAIYRRGIPLVQLPTTLLAQVDSAIGGKTAVDLPHGKNLAGAFYQPKLVFTDTTFLSTLPDRELRCGLAELVKYGVIKDRSLFICIERNLPRILKRDSRCLAPIIRRCAEIKARVVETDEYDRKEKRMILNFGHTIGHAIEAAAAYSRYEHGEAISAGMVCAAEIACHLKMIAPKEVERIEKLLIAVGLPTRIKGCPLEAIMNAQIQDKKFIGKINRFVLPTRIGKVEVRRNIPRSLITRVVKRRIG